MVAGVPVHTLVLHTFFLLKKRKFCFVEACVCNLLITKLCGKISKLLPPICGTIKDVVWRLGISIAVPMPPLNRDDGGLLPEAC